MEEHLVTKIIFELLDLDSEYIALALGNLERHLASDASDVAFELSHTSLASVTADDPLDCFIGELKLLLAQSGLLDLPWDQVSLGDVKLLLFGISREPNHFHAVSQRWRDRRERVGGCDEKHF